MQFIKWGFLSLITTVLMLAMPIDSDVMRAEAGSGPAGHGHGMARDDHGKKDDHGKEARDDHGKEEKGHGGSPAMGYMEQGGHMEKGGHGGSMPSMGKMKMSGHGDDGHRDEGGGHGGGSMKGLSKIEARGFQLLSDLHCNACHYIAPELSHDAGHGGGHGSVAPDLTFLGDKFRPDWLYGFIRKPHIVRPWLKIRMPDFRLNDSEAVSLVNHLAQDMRAPFLPPLPDVRIPLSERKAYIEAGRKLMSEEYFNCWSCHQQGQKKPEGAMENWAPDLVISSKRLRPGWVVRWLQDPQKLMAGTKMPAFFEDAESGPDDILGGDELKQIVAISEYIFSLDGRRGIIGSGGPEFVSREGPDQRSATTPAKKIPEFELATKNYPRASRVRGAQLMSELNCAGCHDVGNMHEREEAGPPLAHEGSRVRKDWLVEFLKKPRRIRPIGYESGAASRMPDFRLNGEEVNAIAAFLATRTDKRMHVDEKPHAVNKKKARRGARLFASLKCASCHATKAEREAKGTNRFAGPDLARAGRRLQEEHLRLWLAGNVPETGSEMEMDTHPLVPKMGLTKKQIEDLSAYVTTLK
jgi:mono/diheme cytochrome c family protein